MILLIGGLAVCILGTYIGIVLMSEGKVLKKASNDLIQTQQDLHQIGITADESIQAYLRDQQNMNKVRIALLKAQQEVLAPKEEKKIIPIESTDVVRDIEI